MTSNKIIIVEDDSRLLKNIVEFLTLEELDVKGVSSALDFFQELSVRNYNIAIIDIGLPDKSGFEIAEYLRANTEMGIIILTARDSITDKIKGYESGADSYFVKPVDCRELTAAVKNLLIRLNNESSNKVKSSAKKLLWEMDSQTRSLIAPSAKRVKLTAKEWSFLEILKTAKGEPVSRDKLLLTLDYNINGPYGSRALDVMVVRLRKKIKDTTGEEPPIITVYSFGYCFPATSA